MTFRSRFIFALGIIMVLLGAYVALRPLWAPRRPLTGAVWLDAAFALVFLVRGLMNIRAARRAPRAQNSQRNMMP